MRRLLPLFLLLIVVLPFVAGRMALAAAPDAFADPTYRSVWQRADGPVAGGGTDRSWTWGPQPGPRLFERYAQTPGGSRLVQYFHKARMEITNPQADQANEWFVTNGLLVVEMIGGRIQRGDDEFADRAAAAIPVAGDGVAGNGPSYATLRGFATINGDHRAGDRTGQRVSALLDHQGGLSDDPNLAVAASELVRYEPITGHNVPRAFADFQRSLAGVTNVLSAFGHPITEPYWVLVQVGGTARHVLVQAFERRVLTFTPGNEPRWQVEMGNVGEHYYRWRYGAPLAYPSAQADGITITPNATTALRAYHYQDALVPSGADDPIYPYHRIDRAKIGPPEWRDYRTVWLENRYLRISFLPELGGRIYQVINNATGQNILYQNPVIKPSHLGQRGWWLAAGGIEWAAPTEEHGYLEYVPWDVRTEQTPALGRVILSTTERHTEIVIEISVELGVESQSFEIRGTYRNPTAAAQPFQFWMNAMIAPGGTNRLSQDLRFAIPDSEMIVHASQDPGLPAARGRISWPVYQGRDLSRYATWNGYIGLFAASDLTGRWAGVYAPGADQGLALADLDRALPGVKMFAFGTSFDRSLYTDDGSDYAELWHGGQPTFWDYPLLEPGASRSFRSTWQPIHGLGDFKAATRAGAVGMTRAPDGALIVGLQAARPTGATTVRISADGQERWSRSMALAPDQPIRVELVDVPPGAAISIEWAGQSVNVGAP